MKRLLGSFPYLVLVGSAFFIHHYSSRPTVGIIEFTGAQVPAWYEITLMPVKQLGNPIMSTTRAGAFHAVVSNVLRPGTKLYEIKGVNHTVAIAVPWHGAYVEAVRSMGHE